MNTNTKYIAPTLATSATLVALHIGTWSATKKDKRASDRTTADNGAATGTAEVRKKLLPGATALEDIKKLERQIRLWHMGQTFSWNDDGQRLLPMRLYTDYVTTAREFERQFWDLVDTRFIPEYPALRAAAQQSLGGLFNDADYPDTATIRSKFRFSVTYEPVPQSGHFVVDIEGQAREELIEQFERSVDLRWAESFKEVCGEFKDTLSHLLKKVSDDGTRVHASILPNIRKVIERMRMANIENNADIEAAASGLESLVSGVSVEALRDNESARVQVREGVSNILSKFNF